MVHEALCSQYGKVKNGENMTPSTKITAEEWVAELDKWAASGPQQQNKAMTSAEIQELLGLTRGRTLKLLRALVGCGTAKCVYVQRTNIAGATTSIPAYIIVAQGEANA